MEGEKEWQQSEWLKMTLRQVFEWQPSQVLVPLAWTLHSHYST